MGGVGRMERIDDGMQFEINTSASCYAWRGKQRRFFPGKMHKWRMEKELPNCRCKCGRRNLLMEAAIAYANESLGIKGLRLHLWLLAMLGGHSASPSIETEPFSQSFGRNTEIALQIVDDLAVLAAGVAVDEGP